MSCQDKHFEQCWNQYLEIIPDVSQFQMIFTDPSCNLFGVNGKNVTDCTVRFYPRGPFRSDLSQILQMSIDIEERKQMFDAFSTSLQYFFMNLEKLEIGFGHNWTGHMQGPDANKTKRK